KCSANLAPGAIVTRWRYSSCPGAFTGFASPSSARVIPLVVVVAPLVVVVVSAATAAVAPSTSAPRRTIAPAVRRSAEGETNGRDIPGTSGARQARCRESALLDPQCSAPIQALRVAREQPIARAGVQAGG